MNVDYGPSSNFVIQATLIILMMMMMMMMMMFKYIINNMNGYKSDIAQIKFYSLFLQRGSIALTLFIYLL